MIMYYRNQRWTRAKVDSPFGGRVFHFSLEQTLLLCPALELNKLLNSRLSMDHGLFVSYIYPESIGKKYFITSNPPD